MPLPRRRLDGCSCSSPLAHFYIHHSDSSIRELHPFTTTTHLASQDTITKANLDDMEIQFLFRKRGVVAPAIEPEAKRGFAPTIFGLVRRIRRRKSQTQWTNRLASLAVEHGHSKGMMTSEGLELGNGGVPVSLRLEGPYFTPANPIRYRTVVCLVAGTGVSGALAIAGMFKELERQDAIPDFRSPSLTVKLGVRVSRDTSPQTRMWTRCVVLWSVRSENFIDLPGLKSQSLKFTCPFIATIANFLAATPNSALDVRIHLTGDGRPRLSVGDALDEILSEDEQDSLQASGDAKMWVYISGPNAFISNGEGACRERQQRGVEWYGARWEI